MAKQMLAGGADIELTSEANKVMQRRAAHLVDFADLLAEVDVVDEHAFTALLAVSPQYDISHLELAKALEVSAGTISRWAHGHVTPPFYARRGIIDTLKRLVADKLGNEDVRRFVGELAPGGRQFG